mmetsp:Transcript_29164/g.45645  ORF Transcript_29164/g.45645 Transcript_29164/m.45645 type:complete len:389 (-) Transcript_29164:111-1277(-)
MVGYDTEDKAYCMELTFNYGLKTYQPGSGLKEFGIFVPDVAAAIQAAKALNYKADNDEIIGPDEYKFRLFKMPEGRVERFSYVLCRSGNLERSVKFYKDVLGFSDAELPSISGLPDKAAALSYQSSSHPHKFEPVVLVFYEDGVSPQTTAWEGRHAFALDAEEVKAIYAKFKAEYPSQIMHDSPDGAICLEEKLGTLFIFIAKDPDGYELCLVSRETMLPAAVEAVTNYDPKLLDWNARDKRIAGIEAAGKEVEKLIAEKPIVVFSKEWCPFCKKAKDAFSDIEAQFFPKELENSERKPLVEDPTYFTQYLAAKTNKGTSVPKVFIKGEFVGGGDDVVAMAKSGQLLTLSVKAGAAKKPAEVSASSTDTHYFCNGYVATKEQYEKHVL